MPAKAKKAKTTAKKPAAKKSVAAKKPAAKKAAPRKVAAKKAAAPKVQKQSGAIKDAFTKSQILAEIANNTGLNKKDVTGVMSELTSLIKRHLDGRGAGEFTIPGLCKFRVIRKPATRARKGINPFTGQETTFAAKPARNVVKIRPMKGVKDMVA